MTHEELVKLDHQYTLQTYGRFDVDIDHGKGARLWDLAGKEYVDFTAGIGTKMLRMTLPGFFEHFMTSGATLTVQLYQYAMRGEDLGISFALAAVLVIIVLIINFSTKRLARRLNAKN